MSAIGFNLLELASQLIGFQTIRHSRWKANVLGEDGIDTPTYYPASTEKASVQPMPRDLIEKMGFDLQKSYLVVYTSADLKVADLERGKSADMIDFECKRYNVESNTPWVDQNGWRASVCCHIGATP